MNNTLQTETYNGWANYETWNVSLWLQNNEYLYNIARRYDDYSKVARMLGWDAQTPDGVSYTDSKLNIDELNEMLADL
jgi:hypothetical protein